MIRQVVSRSQRRMEKKQALIVLVLVLAVALASFSLGVMVGRGGSHPVATVEPATATPRIAVSAEPATPAGAAEVVEVADPLPATQEGGDGLTFYEALPRGEQPPMGSGINLPPEETPVASVATPALRVAPATLPSPQSAPSRLRPATDGEGDYLVQVASFRQAGDASKLAERLALKNYPAYAQEVDLGEKGVWHRVFVGPFPGNEEATRVVQRLQTEDKLTALIRKR
jgi:septal ring-binding cell division protein DamX